MKLPIVLVCPQGDANIGAAARAMKNFGFTDLRLVSPVPHLTKAAYTWAVDAKDLLESAKVCKFLDEALADVGFSVAFTRRAGRSRKRHMRLQDAGRVIAERAGSGGAALVFGREDKGLSNEEIRRCDVIVEIPTSESLPSINLAQSVILASYEVRRSMGIEEGRQVSGDSRSDERFIPRSQIKESLELIGSMLDRLGYADSPRSRLRSKIIAQFEKIFGRAGLTQRDLGMIEGLCARINEVTSR